MLTLRGIITLIVLIVLFALAVVWISKQGGWKGEGLLFFGNVILPFVDHFPKDLELYRILTTRLSEVAEAQKHE